MYRLLIILAATCALSYGSHAPYLNGGIIDGQAIEELPYQLSLQFSNSHICSASIISADWVITAAHCVYGMLLDEISLRTGAGSVHQVELGFFHPQYDPQTLDYDFAVIKASTPFPIGQHNVESISLADSEPAAGDAVIISCWGDSSIIPRDVCQDSNSYFNVTDRMICAGVPVDGKYNCMGESGGPLVSNGSLVGILSWAWSSLPNNFGIFSNVANQRDWIRRQTGV